MKKTILILLVVLFAACTESQKTKEQIIQENITLKLKESMKDPGSFEFVDMKITETFNVKQRKEVITQDKLNEIKEMSKEIDVIDLLNGTEKELSFLNKQTDDNKKAVYYVSFSAKGKNSFGTIVKNDYSATVLNDKKYSIISLK